ncbi:MAG: GNAT family N-acetyltransferase [Candidatus Paceibacterota bacterium]
MIIRKATGDDFPAIEALIALFPDTLMQVHLPRPDEFFVAEEAGQVVGCCALEVYSQRLAEVRSLAVLPAHQGKGIATDLIGKCVDEARALDVYELLSITGATDLFEKQGFKTFKKEKFALIRLLEN